MKKIILMVLLVLLAGCVEIKSPLILDDRNVLPQEICKNINGIIVMHKTGCPACAVALPRLEELEKEVDKQFKYYNLAVEKERNELMALGFIPRYVPTIIVDCKVYSGALEKEEYGEIIK